VEGQAMRQFRDEVRIEAPVEQVWAVLIDTSHWQDWAPRSEFSDFSGPVDQVGTTYADTTRLMGFKFRMTIEVVEVEPLRLYHEHTDTGPVDTVLRLEPDGDATRLVVESDYEIAGRMPGFLKDLIAKGSGERNARQMLASVKALAEAKVPAHASQGATR
jgi:uncharacterized protein YndB with AHSA1/START domain